MRQIHDDSLPPSFRPASAHHVSQGWLEGQLLVATPQVQGDLFAQSVIYLFVHNDEGAMGIVVNRPIDRIEASEVLSQLDIHASPNMRGLPVMHGGPVEEQRGFLLHSEDYESENSLRHPSGLCVTASAGTLRDIAAGRGPRQRMLMLGYAGWSAGQLESEMERNSWISVPASPSIVFHEDNEAKWSLAAASLGIDMGRLSPTAGHA